MHTCMRVPGKTLPEVVDNVDIAGNGNVDQQPKLSVVLGRNGWARGKRVLVVPTGSGSSLHMQPWCD